MLLSKFIDSDVEQGRNVRNLFRSKPYVARNLAAFAALRAFEAETFLVKGERERSDPGAAESFDYRVSAKEELEQCARETA